MRKIFALILSLLMLAMLCSACSNGEKKPAEKIQQSTDDTYDPVNDDKVLKVLAIGNSFSVDTMHYLYDVAKAEGMQEVILGNLYISGCTLKTHAENVKGNLNAYKYYTNYGQGWSSIENCSLEYALKSEDWDIITMQQGSRYSGQPDSYEEHLTQLIAYVNGNKTNPKAKLAWNMTWAYQEGFSKDMFSPYNYDQMTMYNAIVNAVQEKVAVHKEISYIIPVGTVLQNVRTSYIGDNLNRDGYHLNNLARVIGAYTWLATFRGKPLEEINLDKIGADVILTEADKLVIMEVVNAAMETPFAIKESSYPEKPAA